MTPLILSQNGTLSTVPPSLGAVSSPSAVVQLPSSRPSVTVTRDTVSATLASAASKGQTSLTLTATPSPAPVGGRVYVLRGGGVCSLIRVTSSSGAVVTMDAPLVADFPAGSTLTGCMLFAAVSGSDITEVGMGSVRWSATVDGVPYTWDDAFTVDRTVVPYIVTAADLRKYVPEVENLRVGTDKTMNELVEAVHVLYIWPELKAMGVELETVRSWSEFIPAFAESCRVHLLQTDQSVQSDRLSYHKKRQREAMELALKSVRLWVSATDETTREPTPLETTRPRWTR